MKYPFEKQNDLKDCGVSCLSMIIRYYRGRISKEYLRNITNTTKDGVSAYSLIEGSKKIGFSSIGVVGNVLDIEKNQLPCVSHVIINKSYQHFIVIYEIDKKKKTLLIADPSKNKLSKISIEDFNKISSGKFIFLKPNKKIEYIKNNKSLKNMIESIMINNHKLIFSFILLSFLVSFLTILNSFQFKFLLEYVIEFNNSHNLMFLALIFLLVILIKEISSYYRNYFVSLFNLKLDKDLFLNVYNHILSLPYIYYKTRTTGDIISRINDISSIREFISKFLVMVLLDLILMIASFITLLFINVNLTLILTFVSILLFILIIIFKNILSKLIFESKVNSSKLNSYLVETISGIETIKNLNIKDFTYNNFSYLYNFQYKNNYHYNKIYLKEQLIKNIIKECGTLIVIIYGSYLVMNNTLSIASFITYFTLITYFLNPIENFIELHLSYNEAKSSFKRIHELYEIDIKKQTKNSYNDNFINLSTKNLKYSYNGINDILKNINLDIKKKDRVLIYGESGGGKSTLAKILAKHLQINNNLLFYNNVDINLYSDLKINEKVGYVCQKEQLFTSSVYENIILDSNIDYNKFLNICSMCKVDEIVNKDLLNYDMLLEENGFNLSGGQRQRIILARTLIKDYEVYIFDESLNEVDIDLERNILENIFNNFPDKTFIIISHRFNNNDLFNKKYLIKEGISYEM